MFYEHRRYALNEMESAAQLAATLTHGTQCLCTGFVHGGLLWLNDATSEDGAQEYAVLRPRQDGTYDEVESITASWCSEAGILAHIARLTAPGAELTVYRAGVSVATGPRVGHRCRHCA